ncbi:ATP-dependent RecD-like DNA helicase [Rosistilla oblonga]|uniref:AAA domain-containing protein n=1 Tax=Rosistilla oblonga TaxID=2527990 RepID=UPI00118AC2FF|nr:AAA domain-containing protein [Rosistilla oblonga]QDV10284.1 ATP-dependent RecD-like DNA helicase [Rosistilla oblonga]
MSVDDSQWGAGIKGPLEFSPASYAIDLNLPDADNQLLRDAARAIRREYRDSSKWKEMKCRNVRGISESDTGTVFELQIGHAIEFDWSWEGALAFRPLRTKDFKNSDGSLYHNPSLTPEIDDSIVWTGELLEVDEAQGRIFVAVADPEHPPRRGSFYVRPFEFLQFLDRIFNGPEFCDAQSQLAERLLAAQGNMHPQVAEANDVGLPSLVDWWQKSWSVLWGPPGTGKTYTTGQQVAAVLNDPTERILVVSTTNRATDAAAISIGRAAREAGFDLDDGDILRIGKGASLKSFERERLEAMLRGTETDYLAQIDALAQRLVSVEDFEEKALIRKEIKNLQGSMRDAAARNFLDDNVRVVVGTSFKAISSLCYEEVKEDFGRGNAPFTTVFIDEAGLMSRVAVAALSLLASRRVALVGDSKQLAPISRISRILEPAQGNWLARSGLSHLDNINRAVDGVHVLSEQRRMHSDVCDVVSAFQYDGFLTTAPEVDERAFTLPSTLAEQPRAIWYVLDDDTDDIPSIRAGRGPGNRSWVRTATIKVLKKLFADKSLRSANGLFISPFKAQAKSIHSFFVKNEMDSWMASTVHSQQGSEADIVIFDSVNAGSYGWPFDEWKRLVNVALSRARESIIVISSRAEMEEPYLRPLMRHLSPKCVRRKGNRLSWDDVSVETEFKLPEQIAEKSADYKVEEPVSIGGQLAKRKELRPVLSHEQERLCGLELDGKPRLVRGVAGSGKTVVLAHWLMKTVKRLQDEPDVRIWAVFANRSLQSLIETSIHQEWDKETNGKPFPLSRVELHHIREILDVMLRDVGLNAESYGFEYDDAAAAYLEHASASDIRPRCDALFIDEAQDMGPNTLKLLSAIVKQQDEEDENSRAINIFYDNAQNIYGRSTPKWSEFGLDMRGRSTVMKESFRSTKPITEFALNVLYRLQSPESNPDHKELVTRGLVERTIRGDSDWWNVRFNQVDGPKPKFKQYGNLEQEFDAIGDYCRELIVDHGVQPCDICLIYNGSNIPGWLKRRTAPKLGGLGVELSVQRNRPYQRGNHVLLATTSHSFKGYDSEIVIVPGVDQYKANGVGVLANNLYVAMTRARSVLTMFSQRMNDPNSQLLYEVLGDCLDQLEERPDVETDTSGQDDLFDILDQIGHSHRTWLTEIWNKHGISQEPLQTDKGEIVADPLFSFRVATQRYACFGKQPPRKRIRQRLEDFGIKLVEPGQDVMDSANGEKP